MANVVQLFLDNLPLSLAPFVIAIIIYFLFRREKTDVIKNRVEIFYKGGTKGYAECTIGKEDAKFKLGDTEYIEPLLYKPRIETVKGQLYRTFLFAEGIGMVDVPPLPDKDREKIFAYLKEKEFLPEDKLKDKPNYKDWESDELMEYILFYNFDVEQITDKPMMKSFTTSLNFFVSMIDGLIGKIGQLEAKGYSNIAKAVIYLVGCLTGFFIAYAFTLKGVI